MNEGLPWQQDRYVDMWLLDDSADMHAHASWNLSTARTGRW
jgi:hypothetical protein